MNSFGRSKVSRLARLGLVAGLSIVAISGTRTIYPADSQDIALKPLQLDPAHPGPRRVGELIFLNAWELNSDNEDFGGISALAALGDGRFVGLSDAGTLIGFGLTDDNRADRPFIAPLPDAFGDSKSYRDRDSEGLTYDPQSGQFWISFEANHAIRRYSRSFAKTTGSKKLSGKYVWASNKGVEAIARLSDGRFVLIAENLERGLHEGFVFSGDPIEPGSVTTEFNFRPPDGYRVTDAAQMPDGRLMILNRKVGLPDGLSAKLSIVDIAAIVKNETIRGTVIATLSFPLLIDNMEGLALNKRGNESIIWLISDDNFSIFQRTLLMKFRLSERMPKKKPEVAAPGFESL